MADDATRINSTISFEPSGRWYSGPSFLMEPEEDWPGESIEEAPTEDLEVIHHVFQTNVLSFSLKFEQYSTINKPIRVIAWMMRTFGR